MRLDRLFANHQFAGDFLVRATQCQQAQHLRLAFGQFFGAVGRLDFAHQASRGLRRELHLSVGGGFDGAAQFIGLGVLEQVSNRPRAHRAHYFIVLQHAGQRNDLHIGKFFAYVLNCRDAIHHGHDQVHQDDLRMQFADLLDPLRSVRRLAHDLQIWIERKKHAQPLTDYAVIVHK